MSGWGEWEWRGPSLVGQVVNGWEIVADGPYQGLDDYPALGYHGRFWCRVVTARRGDEVTTVRGPESEAMRPDYWPADKPYPTIYSRLTGMVCDER